MNIRHLSIIALQGILLVSSFTIASAQSDSTRLAADAHLWSLDFAIDKYFTPQAFLGSMFSLGRQISPSERIRVSVTAMLHGSDDDENVTHFRADTVNEKHGTQEEAASHFIQCSIQYMSYTSPDEAVAGYFGVGPSLGYSWHKNQQSQLEGQSTPFEERQSWESRGHSVQCGVFASVGAEWFFHRQMSLHAEYGATLAYSWGRGTYTADYRYSYPTPSLQNERFVDEASWSEWAISTSSVLFGISIRF